MANALRVRQGRRMAGAMTSVPSPRSGPGACEGGGHTSNKAREAPMGAGGIGFVVNPIFIVVGVIALGLIAWLFVKR